MAMMWRPSFFVAASVLGNLLFLGLLVQTRIERLAAAQVKRDCNQLLAPGNSLYCEAAGRRIAHGNACVGDAAPRGEISRFVDKLSTNCRQIVDKFCVPQKAVYTSNWGP